MSKKLLFKGGHGTAMTPYEIEDFSWLYIRDPRIDEKTKAYIDSIIGNSVLNLCPYRNVLVTHKYDTVEGNVVTLDDCQDDEIIQLSEIQGNTMVNCNKDTDKELILMPNLETNGYSNVTLTEGMDGGKVDISLEGNTMVNVCDQEEAVAITKSYTVETGNHIALQGEYDGKCRPNIYGNTLVNLCTVENSNVNGTFKRQLAYPVSSTITIICHNLKDFKIAYSKEQDGKWIGNTIISGYKNVITLDSGVTVNELIAGNTEDYNNITYEEFQNLNIVVLEGDYTNKPIPDYFTGMKSSFEDKLITDENDANNGKYKVDYKVTGKNKINNSKLVKGYVTDNGTIVVNVNNNIRSDYTEIQPNTNYILSASSEYNNMLNYSWFDVNKNFIKRDVILTYATSPSNAKYVIVHKALAKTGTVDVSTANIQLQEGTTATTYEPYKEYTKTLYLNSPLLEGDTIEQSGNNIIHNHRYKEVVLDGSDDENWQLGSANNIINQFILYMNPQVKQTTNIPIKCDKVKVVTFNDLDDGTAYGINMSYYLRLNLPDCDAKKGATVNDLKQYLQQNPITVVCELATPTQEIISNNDNLLLDSYTNGHLDVDTVIPIDKVMFNAVKINCQYWYPSTDYILQFESDSTGVIEKAYTNNIQICNNLAIVKGVNKILFTSNTELPYKAVDIYGIGFNMSKIVVTPKVDNNFEYFKGMKSVGECEGNKIEILSMNKNLWNFNDLYEQYSDNNPNITRKFTGILTKISDDEYTIDVTKSTWYCQGIFSTPIYLKKGETLTFSAEARNIGNIAILKLNQFDVYLIDNRNFNEDTYTKNTISYTVASDGYYVARFWTGLNSTAYVKNVQLEKSTTPTEHASHKENKQTMTHEPLRGLPNGVKDKYVIIDGKWYIERNTVEIDLSTISLKDWKTWTDNNTEYWSFYAYHKLLKYEVNEQEITNTYCNTRPYVTNMNTIRGQNGIGVYIGKGNSDRGGYIAIGFKRTELSSIDTTGLKQWLINNPTKIIAEAQPTYEPIDYNPFEVYTDTTHISNNSTIPCNMVIRNSGFNCILKPNTKYTVSSSNGLSTVTTKDSIGDSVLRFYNKDTSSVTKMSKVLVLEGDYITGNPPIPTFFEGMESAFEQELVTDENDEHYGKYKVNVKVVGKNLFNKNDLEVGSLSPTGQMENITTRCRTSKNIKIKPGTYTLSKNTKEWYAIFKTDSAGKVLKSIVDESSKGNTFTIPNDVNYIKIKFDYTLSVAINDNIQLEEGTEPTEYEPYKENNITFYLNEPLRGVGNIKDKVYVKEDKVVVERNCSSVTLDGSDDENWQAPSNANYKYGVFTLRLPLNHKNVKVNDKNEQGAICNTLIPYWWWTNNDSFETVPDNSIHYLTWENTNTFYIIKKNLKTVDEIKQWLKSNKTEYIYPLKTPTYEEVECDLSKLALEGYNHGTLFYNSNIPVTTQFYDFNVDIKDMLIPNETYYVTFIADRVKDITINLSGVQVNYKTSMGYNKVPVQLGDVVNTNFSMDSKGVELSDLMISTSTSLIYVKDMNDVCVYDEATNKYSITITSTDGNESDKRVILLDYPLLRLNKDVYDGLYYNNKDSRYRIDKKVFKHKFTNDCEYSKYAAETNDTYYSSFISFDESIKDYVVITNEKVKTVKVEDDKYYFKIKWSDLDVSDKTEANGNQGMKDFFSNNEVYLYYATDGFVEVVDGLRRQTLKVYQPETTINFLGNTTTTVTIVIPKKNV